MSLHHMMEQDLSIFVHPILTLSPFALFATTILAARSNISTTLKPVRAEHSAKLAALISFCTSIISLYLKKDIFKFQNHFEFSNKSVKVALFSNIDIYIP